MNLDYKAIKLRKNITLPLKGFKLTFILLKKQRFLKKEFISETLIADTIVVWGCNFTAISGHNNSLFLTATCRPKASR